MNTSFLLIIITALNVIALVLLFALFKRSAAGNSDQLSSRLESLDQSMGARLTQLAVQLEQTRGGLNLELTKQLSEGLSSVRAAVETQLTEGRREQGTALTQSISLLDQRFDQLARRQSESAQESRAELSKALEAMRTEVDRKLVEISGQVQEKLDKNIREGFAHFEKVQEHLKAAEEQLRNVSDIGESIHSLNNLLRLPHMRGKFGEASLERLLQDFLPANMYTLQMGPENSSGRADAMIHFPERNLPIDAKFPREQVLALFEEAEGQTLEEARDKFARVLKEQAKRVKGYIQPENGTTDMALLYLPSETLFMETVRNRELSEELNKMRVFPVSPNTLLVTLQAIAMVHKWYQVQKGLAKTIEEFGRAQKNLANFESKFEVLGRSLEKAQEAYSTASTHLNRYKNKVTQLSGEPVPELGTDGEQDDNKQLATNA
jgi:DNA recombination protein RmuC